MKNLSPKTKSWLIPVGIIAAFGTLLTVIIIFIVSLANMVTASLGSFMATRGESMAISLAEKKIDSLPTYTEASVLSADALIRIDKSVKTENFEDLHVAISKIWQEQITPDELKSILQPLVDEGTDFAGLSKLEAVFDKDPLISEEGILELSGFFPTQPRRVVFELSYIREATGWELFGFAVRTGSNPLPLPGLEEVEGLTEKTLLDFNSSLRAEDFTLFHAGISIPFQKQLGADGFKAAFQALIDDQTDLTVINGLKPTFTNEITLDENGMMELIGIYPTENETIEFELLFTPEPPDWKLLGISLSIVPLVAAEELNPIEDLVQFLEKNVALADEADRSELAKQLSALVEFEKSIRN